MVYKYYTILTYNTDCLHVSMVTIRPHPLYYLSCVYIHHSTISQFDPCDSHVTNLPCVCMGGCMCMCVYVQQNYQCFHAVCHVTVM